MLNLQLYFNFFLYQNFSVSTNLCTFFRGLSDAAVLVGVIDFNEAKTFEKTVGPLEIVEKGPIKVTDDVCTFGHRASEFAQMILNKFRAFIVISGCYSVFGNH